MTEQEHTARFGSNFIGHAASGSNLDVAVKMVKGVGRAAEEAWVLKSLSHTNIIPILDYFAHNGHDCIVLPLAYCGTLADHSATYGIPPQSAIDVARQLTLALEYIHIHGYLHGDVKMENVVVHRPQEHSGKRCIVQLADFGSAARLAGDCACDRPPQGTACFSPPECFSPERVNGLWMYGASADIWSLGCLLWEAVTSDCLPLGAGPDVLGRVAKEAKTEEWEKLCAKLLHTAETKMRKSVSSLAEGKHQAEAAARVLLPLIETSWAISPKERPAAVATARGTPVWADNFSCIFPEVVDLGGTST